MRSLKRSCIYARPITWDRFAFAWYLERHHDIKTSDDPVHRVCRRHGIARLPNGSRPRVPGSVPLARCGPGHGTVYIKPRAPQLNEKVERSHRTDKDEFNQRLTYRDDVDLEKKLAVWERFYNFDRPHGAHGDKTPYEALREKQSE